MIAAKCIEPRPFFIGSCSVMAHCGCAHRLPGDVDVVVSGTGVAGLRSCLLGLSAQVVERIGFLEAVLNKVRIHVVVDALKLLDSTRTSVLSEVSLRLEQEEVEEKVLRFLCSDTVVSVPVPKREIVLALTLLAPLSSQSAYDALRLVSVGPLSAPVLHRFLARNPIAARLFVNRAKALGSRSNLPLAAEYRAWAEASRAVERAASALEGL